MNPKQARQLVLSLIRQVYETTDIQEAAQMLASGKWIAICATTKWPITIVLGCLEPSSQKMDGQGNK